MTYAELVQLLDMPLPYIAVVANGQMPTSENVICLLKQSTFTIACDGAGCKLNSMNIVPDYIVGDNDSNFKTGTAKNPYVFIEDQNCNDLTKAINFVMENYGTQLPIIIFAANGLREDHALANIALFMQYATKFTTILMISDYGIFNIANSGKNNFKTLIGQQISFFSLEHENVINCSELKWPLNDIKFPYLNSGTLNQATKNYLQISCDKPILLYRTFEIK